MKAKLTNRHTLHIAQAPVSKGRVTPMDPQFIPGTWGSWLLDEGALVPGSQFQLGAGAFHGAYKRTAYDQSVALLKSLGSIDGLIPFEKLHWDSISTL
jgi:hypothetical protein